jgi:hypothetical protein
VFGCTEPSGFVGLLTGEWNPRALSSLVRVRWCSGLVLRHVEQVQILQVYVDR